MTDRDDTNYRFEGYQLPMIQLDATGPQYVQIQPHTYYYNQPAFWTKPYYEGHPMGFANDRRFPSRPPGTPQPPGTNPLSENSPKDGLYPLL